MIKVENIEEVYDAVRKEKLVLIEAGSESCGPCMAIREKLSDWLEDHKEIKGFYVSIEEFPEIAGREGKFSAPAVILYAEGKQTVRETGCFSLEAVLDKVLRYEKLMK